MYVVCVKIVYVTDAHPDRNHVLAHAPAAGCGRVVNSTYSCYVLQLQVHELSKHHSRAMVYELGAYEPTCTPRLATPLEQVVINSNFRHGGSVSIVSLSWI